MSNPMKTTAQLLALHEQAQRIIAELSLTEAIRRDAAAIERLRAEAVEKRLLLDFVEPQVLCFRCSRRIEFCICGLWDHAPMTAEEHGKFPNGRYCQ